MKRTGGGKDVLINSDTLVGKTGEDELCATIFGIGKHRKREGGKITSISKLGTA